MASKTDVQVLAPKPVAVSIEGRDFIQKALSLRGTTKLITAIAEEIQKIASSAALDTFLETDLSDTASLAPLVINLLKTIPNALPRILGIILGGSGEDDDDVFTELVAFIDLNCRFSQALRIVRTFIDQNEPEEIIENFMVLRATLSDAFSKAKAKLETV